MLIQNPKQTCPLFEHNWIEQSVSECGVPAKAHVAQAKLN